MMSKEEEARKLLEDPEKLRLWLDDQRQFNAEARYKFEFWKAGVRAREVLWPWRIILPLLLALMFVIMA